MKAAWHPGRATEAEVRAYCKEWADVIFVRERIERRWTSVSLAELPTELREKWVATFVQRGVVPHRIAR